VRTKAEQRIWLFIPRFRAQAHWFLLCSRQIWPLAAGSRNDKSSHGTSVGYTQFPTTTARPLRCCVRAPNNRPRALGGLPHDDPLVPSGLLWLGPPSIARKHLAAPPRDDRSSSSGLLWLGPPSNRPRTLGGPLDPLLAHRSGENSLLRDHDNAADSTLVPLPNVNGQARLLDRRTAETTRELLPFAR
jgi:hypothetical protein